MIDVKENEDGTFTISWDENDPTESIFNDFKEEDFIKLIQDYLQSLEESGKVDINQVAEAVNHINDHIEEEIINTCEETFGKECYQGAEHKDYYEYIDQTAEEVQQDINTAQEFIRDQSTEQSQTGTVPPPQHFPLFP